MRQSFSSAALFLGVCLSSFLLNGCSDDGTVTSGTPSPAIAQGNWQVSAVGSAATRLPSLSGALTTKGTSVTAVVHAQAATSCISPKTAFELTGATDSKNVVTLTGPLAGGTLTLSGTLAPDGKSLTDAAYSVSGGSCAMTTKTQATALAFQPITGSYSGSFSDPDGQLVTISAALTQSPSSDPDGNFTLSGTATLPNNPCFPVSVPISATSVSGGQFTFTYATSDNSVTANGTFSQDASALVVTSWTATGTCGADHGTGSLTRQSASE